MNAKQKIIYDANCPLCVWYTGQFEEIGILQKGERQSFDNTTDEEVNKYDEKRARHEIPLIDLNGGETLYGVNALCFLLSRRWPGLRFILMNRIFQLCWLPFYKLISFNRRLIVGKKDINREYGPEFNVLWRSVYLMLCAGCFLIVCYVQTQLIHTAQHQAVILVVPAFVFMLLTFPMLLLQRGFEKLMDYAAQLATISIIISGSQFLSQLLAFLFDYPNLALLSVLPLSICSLFMHRNRSRNYDLPLYYHLLYLAAMCSTVVLYLSQEHQQLFGQ